ncbi:Hypp217 [Branchiostoma lanceolatum]|uniref:Hypp217 protein n=1 Tax=Branchiostoma lanceolatum TaxID=7740 RepID=A0A8J9V7M0_BRALA|nr:Hypp217 [Branchiostoma lanceolatum]
MVAFKSEGENQEGENNMETNPLSPEPYRVKLKEMTREVSELLQDQAELNEEVDTLRQCQEKVDFLILENKNLLFEENGWLADEEDIGSQADTDFEEDSVLQSLREDLAITQEQLKEKDKKLQEAEEKVAQLTEELDRLKSGRKAAKKPATKTEKRRRSTTSQEVSLLESHMVFSTKVETILGEVREHVQKLEVENAKLKDEKKELELKLTKEKS